MLDLPGFGGSSKPALAQYNAAFFARATLGVMDALGIERAHLIGNSMGGRVALEVGLREPGAGRRPRAAVPGAGVRAPRLRSRSCGCCGPELGLLPHSLGRGRIERQFWSMFADRDLVDPSVADIVVDEFERIYRSAGARLAFLASARSIYLDPPFGRGGLFPRLEALEPPAMFVWGSHDKLIPPGFSRHVERWLPGAEQIVLEGCGHVPQVERPERTNGLITRFFARIDALGAAVPGARRWSPPRLRCDGLPMRGPPLDARPGRRGRPARLQARSARIPAADLDERDPDYIRESLPRLWLLASLYFRAEVRGLGNVPEEGPVLLVGNHSGGNLTPDTGVFTLAFSTYFGVERRLLPARPQPRALDARAVVPAQVRHGRRLARERPQGARGRRRRARLPRRRLRGPPAELGAATASTSAAARASCGSRSTQGVPIVPVVSIGGQETALFLSRGERLAKGLRLDKLFRLKVLPISIALPWGINVGDMLGHLPLPAKITVEALPPIDLRREFGDDPDLDEVYDHLVRLMQETLDALAAERRCPVIG